MAFENPFLRQSSVRNSALDYLFSDEPEGDSVQAPTPSNSYAYATPSNNAPDTSVIAQVFGLTNIFGEGSSSGDGSNTNTGQGPIGIGKATDAIRNQALRSAALGFLTGGVPGAFQKGVKSLVSGAHGFLDRVNATEDPLAAWAIEQGWAPVPEVNMETPYGGGGAPTGTPAAVTSPVDMSFSPTSPIAPMGMFSSATAEAQAQAQAQAQADAQAAENDAIAAQAQAQAAAQAQAQAAAQAQAQAQAQANAAANAAAIAAAQNSGSYSDSGGDLGTGASDAAGFGGYGGVW